MESFGIGRMTKLDRSKNYLTLNSRTHNAQQDRERQQENQQQQQQQPQQQQKTTATRPSLTAGPPRDGPCPRVRQKHYNNIDAAQHQPPKSMYFRC
jgi:hypothetical protein